MIPTATLLGDIDGNEDPRVALPTTLSYRGVDNALSCNSNQECDLFVGGRSTIAIRMSTSYDEIIRIFTAISAVA